MTVICLPVCSLHSDRLYGVAQRGALVLAALLFTVCAAASDDISLHFGALAGTGWQAQNIDIQLTGLTTSASALRVHIGTLDLPAPLGPLKDLQLTCAAVQLQPEAVECRAGQLHAVGAWLAADTIPVAFSYRVLERAVRVTLKNARVAGGQLSVEARSDAQAWRLDYDARQLDAARLLPLLKPFVVLQSASGQINLRGQLSGNRSALSAFRVDGAARSLAYATPDGTKAAEAFNLQGQLSGVQSTQGWRLQTQLALHDGTLCIATCWALPHEPLQLTAKALWSTATSRLQLMPLTFTQTGLGQGAVTGTVVFTKALRVPAMTLHLQNGQWQRLYTSYLQPLLIGTALEAASLQGGVAADIEYHDQGPILASMRLTDTTLEDQHGRYGVQGLNGALAWRSDAAPQRSTLRWTAGHVYKLTLGGAAVDLQTQGYALKLLQPLHLPILDGQLDVDHLGLSRNPAGKLQWQFDGVLSPISMQAFSAAVGWPVMHGKLSGMIPAVHYDGDVLEVGGVLLIRAFDGAITLRKLRVERLFGVAPSLKADIKLDNLDLDALTRTFAFGNIQGRFSGQVDNLQMINWRPVAFNAWFGTPPNDRSRHRISQRAVENISQIGGGGIGGTLSRSFLRVFDQFSYDRLGIRCTLHNGVCDMDGVAPAQNGYYLVKGGGLPRIDIIGYAHRVDWDTLASRITNITNAPVVK
ncbi:MAG: hypothetical protein ACYC7I_01125 [Gammaproteobacteria bacterium]